MLHNLFLLHSYSFEKSGGNINNGIKYIKESGKKDRKVWLQEV